MFRLGYTAYHDRLHTLLANAVDLVQLCHLLCIHIWVRCISYIDASLVTDHTQVDALVLLMQLPTRVPSSLTSYRTFVGSTNTRDVFDVMNTLDMVVYHVTEEKQFG